MSDYESSEKRIFCEVCDEGFRSEATLEKHCEHVHNETDSSDLHKNACDVCGKVLKTKFSLLSHRKLHTGEGVLECDLCGKKCQTKCTLKQHLLTHNGQRAHPCATCGLSFKQKIHLVNHQRTHTAERPFLCSTCGKGFRQRYDLVRHVRVHTGEKPFRCPSCPQSFRIKSILSNHMRTHSGEKPYSCPQCCSAFRVKSTLDRHLLVHSETKAYICNQCHRSFKRKEHLQQHMKSHGIGIRAPKPPPAAPATSQDVVQLTIVQFLPEEKDASSLSIQACDPANTAMQTHHDVSSAINPFTDLSNNHPTDVLSSNLPFMPNHSFPLSYPPVTKFADVSSLSCSSLALAPPDPFQCILPSNPTLDENPFPEEVPVFTSYGTARDDEHLLHSTDIVVLKPVLLPDALSAAVPPLTDMLPPPPPPLAPASSHPTEASNHHNAPLSTEEFYLNVPCHTQSVGDEVTQAESNVDTCVKPSREALAHVDVNHADLPAADCIITQLPAGVPAAEPKTTGAEDEEVKEGGGLQCVTCKLLFKSKRQLITHSEKCNSPEKLPMCQDCGKCFRSGNHLRSHKSSVHRDTQSVLCPTCGKSLKGKSSLALHMAIHKDIRSFVCSECSKSFRQKVHLQRHMMRHTGEKPCLCEYCPKRFQQLADLERHMRTHTGEKPFSCPQCNKSFAVEHSLKFHLRIHSGEKPYSCNVCKATFRVKVTLDRHMTTHSELRPFKCTGCKQAFKRKDHLLQHWRTLSVNCSSAAGCAKSKSEDIDMCATMLMELKPE